MWTTEIFLSILLPTLILLIGLIDDLYCRKFHNWLFLSILLFLFCCLLGLQGTDGLIKGFQGLAVAFAISLPLVLLGVMGAGDMKLLMVFAMATNASVAFHVMMMAFFWGGLMGVLYALLSGKAFSLFNNLKFLLLYRIKPVSSSLHVIPYTVAIFMGWSTHVLILTPYYKEFQLWS